MESFVFDIKNKHDFAFEGFGTSLSWFAVGIKDRSHADDLCDILFNPEREDGLQLNIVRYNIGGSNDKTHEMRNGGKVQEYSSENWDYTDENQVYFLKKSFECGAKIFESFSNSPPMKMTRSGQTSGANPWSIFKNKIGFSNNLKNDEIENFTSYLANVTNFLISKGIPFSSISPINEPSSPGWVNGNNQEGCFYGFLGIRRKVFSSLRKKTNLDISGFEENNMLQGVFGLLTNPFINIDKYNIHRYTVGNALGFNTREIEDSNILRKIIRFLVGIRGKKRIWMSEAGFGYINSSKSYSDIRNTLNFASKVIDDLNYLKPTAWVYWQVIEDLSNNGWGCMQVDFNNPSNRIFGSQFTAFQHFTHFIKPGNFLVDVKQPSNKNIKWIASIDPKTLIKSAVVVSFDENHSKIDVSLLGIKVVILSIMESAGNTNLTEVIINKNNYSNEPLVVKSNSVLSFNFM
jgi:O-glycosyl hydrolase